MAEYISLSRVSVGLITPQGIGAIQHKADNFTEIGLIPGHLIFVRKRSRDGKDTITTTEIFANTVPFWEYEILGQEKQLPANTEGSVPDAAASGTTASGLLIP